MLRKEFGAYLSLDWADQKHTGCLREIETGVTEHFELEQKAEAIQKWVGKLRQRFHGREIAVILEQKRGALIYALMKYELFVLFPINTTAAKNFRKALRASGAKDDPSDAEILLEFLMSQIHRLKPWEPESLISRQLRLLTENRRNIVDDASAVSNQITALLKEYYPTALEMIGNVKTTLACQFLKRWPTLEILKRTKPEKLRAFYSKRNCRDRRLIEERLQIAAAAVPLIDEKPMIEVYKQMLLARVNQLIGLLKSVGEISDRIELIFNNHQDREIYLSFPSVGPALAPRLAVALGEDRNKFDAPAAIQTLSGVAPITVASGQSRAVHFRFAAPKFQRRTFIEFARLSIKKSLWARAYYCHCRKTKEMTHQASIRALAYKWIRILYRCWKNRERYDEQKYITALKNRKSPLFRLLHRR